MKLPLIIRYMPINKRLQIAHIRDSMMSATSEGKPFLKSKKEKKAIREVVVSELILDIKNGVDFTEGRAILDPLTEEILSNRYFLDTEMIRQAIEKGVDVCLVEVDIDKLESVWGMFYKNNDLSSVIFNARNFVHRELHTPFYVSKGDYIEHFASIHEIRKPYSTKKIEENPFYKSSNKDGIIHQSPLYDLVSVSHRVKEWKDPATFAHLPRKKQVVFSLPITEETFYYINDRGRVVDSEPIGGAQCTFSEVEAKEWKRSLVDFSPKDTALVLGYIDDSLTLVIKEFQTEQLHKDALMDLGEESEASIPYWVFWSFNNLATFRDDLLAILK